MGKNQENVVQFIVSGVPGSHSTNRDELLVGKLGLVHEVHDTAECPLMC